MPNATCSIPSVPFNKTKMLSAMRRKGILSVRDLCGNHEFHRCYVTMCKYFKEERMPIDILEEMCRFLEGDVAENRHKKAKKDMSAHLRPPELIDCYPANVLAAALGLDKKDPSANVTIAGYDLRPMYELDFLTDRERKVISYRFLDRMTLDEVAAVFGITRERIRQVEAKALRKIRGRRHNWVIYSKQDMHNYAKQTLDEIKAAVSGEEAAPPSQSAGIEVLDLSVRAYNCLHRSGITTIQELIAFDKNQSDEFMKGRYNRTWISIRNMGVRTFKEVHDRVLDRIGYEIHRDF